MQCTLICQRGTPKIRLLHPIVQVIKKTFRFLDGECLTKSKDDSPQRGKPCRFPFIYKGITYSECTDKSWNKPWCSTHVDKEGKFISDKWGNCDTGCELGNKISFRHKSCP